MLADASRARILEQLGIDYCCGGRKTLAAACQTRSLDRDDVIAALAGQRDGDTGQTNWSVAPLPQVTPPANHVLTFAAITTTTTTTTLAPEDR